MSSNGTTFRSNGTTINNNHQIQTVWFSKSNCHPFVVIVSWFVFCFFLFCFSSILKCVSLFLSYFCFIQKQCVTKLSRNVTTKFFLVHTIFLFVFCAACFALLLSCLPHWDMWVISQKNRSKSISQTFEASWKITLHSMRDNVNETKRYN